MIFISKESEISSIKNQYILNMYKNSKLEEINQYDNNLKDSDYENNYLDNFFICY